MKSKDTLRSPVGYPTYMTEMIPDSQEILDNRRFKKALEIAKSPLKTLPMNIFMSWMVGNSLHLFSMLFLVMMFQTPIKNIWNINSAFSILGEDLDLKVPKAVCVASNIIVLALPIYKAYNMGLLPTTADYLMFVTPERATELSVGGAV
ncbi:ER membrane protein complex subunit 4-like [Zophobas morio]|uniref:ER membrane protein complex subunit 4-like n=1 Tax=Zophobas morio TaxID=2755281 RepID=UPI0030829F4E